MKRIAIAAILAAVSAPAFAATDSASTTLSGTVAQVLDVSAPTNASLGDLSSSAVGGTALLGDVNVKSNSPNGLSVKISSLNGGKLLGPQSQSFGYSLTAPGVGTITPTVAGAPFNVNGGQLGGYLLGNGQTVPVTIKLTSLPTNKFAGTYNDTVTFTVEAN